MRHLDGQVRGERNLGLLDPSPAGGLRGADDDGAERSP